MLEEKLKVKRLSNVLKTKRFAQEKLTNQLKHLQAEWKRTVDDLEECKKAYFMGVQKLNVIRQSPLREGVDIFDSGLDAVKEAWMLVFHRKQDIEQKMATLTQDIHFMQMQIEAVEKMQGKYKDQIKKSLDKKEQEHIDAFYGVKIQKGSP